MKSLVGVCVGVLVLFGSVGMGLAADANLTWNANTETDLQGYKVYFAPQSCGAQGPLAPLVVGGNPVTLGKVVTYKHVGIPVVDGTLCWEITAFDTSGNESVRSNRVSKTVNLVPPIPPSGLDVTVVP